MPYGEDITINVGDAVRIHPKYENHKFKKLKYGVTYFVKEMHTDYTKKIRYLETEKGDTILLNMDQTYFEHAGKEEQMEDDEDFQPDYALEVGDIVLIQNSGHGFISKDKNKYVEVTAHGDYFGGEGVRVRPYECRLETPAHGVVGYGSFGKSPLILLNVNGDVEVPAPTEELVELLKEDSYCMEHYNLCYTLTEKDIEAGEIKVDAYWVAKQWKTGSRDDSGALWHSLKTIARFGEKNDKAREIKALYNQAIALARIYDVEL